VEGGKSADTPLDAARRLRDPGGGCAFIFAPGRSAQTAAEDDDRRLPHADTDGILKLYWGESKIYKDPGAAIRECLTSLAPFLIELDHEGAERERDLILLADKADLSKPELTEALKLFFDKNSPKSKRVQYCGVALVGFDAAFYPADQVQAVADAIAYAARLELEAWCATIGQRLTTEKLEHVDIELFCLPLPSAEGFRAAFLTAMGVAE
jgi:hypothetical protein